MKKIMTKKVIRMIMPNLLKKVISLVGGKRKTKDKLDINPAPQAHFQR
jgi:hypothetical protein